MFGVRALSRNEPDTPFASILGGACIAPSTVLLRRSVYEETPRWDEAFGHGHEDADLFLQIALRSQVHLLPTVLTGYRQHSAQNTKNPARVYQGERNLHEKWRRLDGLTPQQMAVVANAQRFVYGKLAAFRGMVAGNRRVREGHFWTAFRFYGGAIRLYLRSIFFPRSFNAR